MSELSSTEAALTLFVEAMAGRYLHIRPLASYDGQVPLSDFATQSADAIYLPEALPGNRRADYRVLAMQQVAQRLYGTFAFDLPRLLATGAALGDTAPPEDASRTGNLQQLRARYRLPWLYQTLFETAERMRLDARTLDRFPGLLRHYAAYYATSAQGPGAALEDTLPQGVTREAGLALGVALADTLQTFAAAHRHWLRSGEAPAGPGHSSLYHRNAEVDASVLLADACYRSMTAHLALPQLQQLADAQPRQPAQTSADWLERKARLEDWEAEQAGLKTLLMNAELLDPSDVDAAENEGLVGDVKPEGVSLKKIAKTDDGLDPDALERRLAMERAAMRHALGQDRSLARSYRYDEWDALAQRYRSRWCCLYEEDLVPDPDTDGQALAARVRPWRDEIRARLSQVKPLGYVRQRALEDGDELDFNAVLDSRLEAAAGLTPSDRVYSRKDRLQRDLCCAFLIDLSASTDDPMQLDGDEPLEAAISEPTEAANLRDPFDVDYDEIPPPAEPKRRIIDVQREAMLAMATALENLGDEYGIYGFSGYGRECVEYYVAKAIGAPFTPRTLHSIAAMKPRRSTRMGPAIRHTTNKLLASGHAMKLMIMLSDGFPQDSDYGPVRGDHDYGVQDTAKAIEEAEAAGIRTFCITVDQSGHDYLSRMCPSEQYLIINETAELPAALSKVYARLAT